MAPALLCISFGRGADAHVPPGKRGHSSMRGPLISHSLLVSVCMTLAFAVSAPAQERAGIVTTLQGNVTVARAESTEPAPLKFRDDIFVSDRIAAGKDSIARILLGGRAVVTIREYSVVTITELPGVARVDVSSGRAAVAVARERMRPGDVVEVRTPNAVAGVRGTVVVAEVFETRSVLTVLKGVVDVTRLNGGRPEGPATMLGALQQMTVVGAAPLPTPQPISSDAAKKLGGEFRAAPPRPAANTVVASAEVERTARSLNVPRTPAGGDAIPLKLDVVKTDKDDKERETKGTTRTVTPVFNGPAPTLGWTAPSTVTKDVLTSQTPPRIKDKDR
jgi:FecR-like protein